MNCADTADSVGMAFEKHTLPETSRTEDIQEIVRVLNERSDIHGIIVQLPLPAGIDTDAVIATIRPEKDADGFHPETVARFLSGQSSVPPVFPRAILALIKSTGVPLDGKRAIAFVNSTLFARVIVATLGQVGIQTEDSLTIGLQTARERLPEFDIVITAKGDPHFLRGDMIRPGAVVIDGVSRAFLYPLDPKNFLKWFFIITESPSR